MTDRERIEQALAQEGYTAKEWREGDDGLEAVIGRFEVVTDEYEDEGIYLEEEGVLTASVVGAERYHNQRVYFGFMAEGTDSPMEVRHLGGLEPMDV